MKSSHGFSAAVLVVLAMCFSQVGLAQVVPYRVEGTGSVDPATGAFGGPSIGLHMGQMTYSGNITSQVPTGPFTVAWTAVDTQVAADGSTISLSGAGTATIIPISFPTVYAVWSGQWTVTGGTGRFANVQNVGGPIQMVALNDPFDVTDNVTPRGLSYQKVGRIDLGRR